MTISPYPFQRHDLNLLARHNYTGLMNVQPGGGKTVTGAFSIKESGASTTLVIAPEATHGTAWAPTVADVTGHELRVIGNNTKAKRQALTDFMMGVPGVFAVTPQLFTRADISNWSGDLLITDEGHMLNKPGGQGQRKWSGYTAADKDPISTRFDGRMFLSGTAWRNDFSRAWATARHLWPHLDDIGDVAEYNFWAWQNRRMSFEEVYTSQIDARTGQYKKVKKFLNEKVPGQFISEVPLAITHFRREACCAFHNDPASPGFLPIAEPQVIHQTIELAPAQKKAITQLENHYVTYLADKPLTVDLTLTQMQRVRQITLGVPFVETYVNEAGDEKVTIDFDVDCKSPFTDALLNILDENEGEPVTVYLESQKFASVLVKKLESFGIPAFEYSGATTKTRELMLSQYGTTYRAAVIVLAAGGVGLDGLQKVSNIEVWMERSVDETNNVQGEARQDRLGAKARTQRYILHDDEGRSEGRMNEQLERRRALAATLRKDGVALTPSPR